MKSETNAENSFDVIIVGAGTAGCVLAERLTSSGRLRVLLIEAGGRPSNKFVAIPAGFTRLFKSECDWDYQTEPQVAVGDRSVYVPRGKMLGGSANMNAMMHQWCHPADFDGWVEAGATGWGWSDVAPVFAAQETWQDHDGDSIRGRTGPMRIEANRNARPLSHWFVQAARQIGLGNATQYNGRAYQGAWIAELAHKNGKRFSVYHAYLLPAMRRNNLVVATGFHATKIEIENGRAVGVTAHRDNYQQSYHARKVVLSAGAYGSPQLLMLSGIGPAERLKSVGLPVHVDAPEVGENLQDHPVLPLVFSTSSTDTLKRAESPLELLRYLLLKKGMLASNGVEGFAFTRTPMSTVDAPDLEIMFLPFECRNEFLEPPLQHAFSLGPAVVAPRSRGRLTLRSSDAKTPPRIDPGLLSDSQGIDASVLWHGVRLCRQIATTSPLAKWNNGEILPGPSVHSDRDLIDYASSAVQTVYHPTSTCRMGSDARSVVDPQLKLRGVAGLWIADASVMPTVPRGHPNAVVAMIANRAAGWIEQTAIQ